MKLISIIILVTIAVVVKAKRPWTTPSPFGTYRLKQIKCSCNEKIFQYLYSNFTCYAKALSRDVTTANGYGMMRREVRKIWGWGFVEYKYGTIYRTIITTPKYEGCEIMDLAFNLGDTSRNPLFRLGFKYLELTVAQYGFERLLHRCPFRAGEYLDAYNVTMDPKHIPSLFNQGDYRATGYVYVDKPDNLVCNNSVTLSFTSPIKESFGRK